MKFSTAIPFLAAGALAAPAAEQQSDAAMPRPVSGPRVKGEGRFGSNTVQNPWGGPVQEGTNWKTVSGTTIIPKVSGQSSSAGAAAWVGIDGT